MMVSTKGRYALRVMLDLSLHDTDDYISLKVIAERQGISMKYLEMVVAMLHKAKMVRSMRGKDGGYQLSRKPSEYTIGSILKLTEGTLAPVAVSYTHLDVYKRQPSKSEDGTLRIQYVQISKSEPVHEGYLPFEWNLILEQAGKLKGMPYGWGDTGGNMDCSSTMCSVYKCFGIRLPRDTSGQSLMCGIQLEGLAAEEKQEILRGLKPGTLLYMPGHVMMYLGEEEGEPRILHNVTAYSENGDTIYAQQCCITGLDIMRMNGESYWDSLTGAWELCTEP